MEIYNNSRNGFLVPPSDGRHLKEKKSAQIQINWNASRNTMLIGKKNPTKRKNEFRIEHVSQSKAHIFRKNVEVLKLKLIQAILISTRYEVKNFTAINDYYD